jgi:hypothetical protein
MVVMMVMGTVSIPIGRGQAFFVALMMVVATKWSAEILHGHYQRLTGEHARGGDDDVSVCCVWYLAC